MKVLFDHQTFSQQRYGGISRYFARLANGLNNKKGISNKIAILYSQNEYLKKTHPWLSSSLLTKIFEGHFNRLYRWNRRISQLYIRLNNFDVFHPTYYDPYFIDSIKKPFVITVHDMIHELMPEAYTDDPKMIPNKRLMISTADAIIAISAYTRDQIIKYYPEAAGKITVVHHGYAIGKVSAANMTLPNRYILFVGDRALYKNFTPFVKAIGSLLQQDSRLHLICAGGGKFTKAEQQVLADLNIYGQCRQISATDSELKQLYSQALLFAFPSLQEGFGLPLLEAFANNCPVACSDATCFPEIAGDAAFYFDPLNELSINTAIKILISDENARQQLIKKGQQKLEAYPFQKCIDNTIQVYSTLLKSYVP